MPHNLTHFMISEVTDWRDGDLRFTDVYALHRQYFPSDYYFASTRLPPGEEGTIADLIIAMMENYLKNDRPIHHLFDRLQISLEERDPIDRERQRSFKERQVNLIKQMVIQKIGTKYTSAVEKFMRERICIVNPKIERLPIGRAYKYDPENAKSLFSAVGIMSDDHVALTTEGFRWYTTEAVGPLAPGGFKSGLVSAGSTWSFPANHDGPKMADALDAIFINEFGGSTTHKAIFNLPLRLITNEGPLVHTYLARDIGALAIFMDQMAELESSDRIHPLSSDGMKGLMLDAFEDYLTVKKRISDIVNHPMQGPYASYYQELGKTAILTMDFFFKNAFKLLVRRKHAGIVFHLASAIKTAGKDIGKTETQRQIVRDLRKIYD